MFNGTHSGRTCSGWVWHPYRPATSRPCRRAHDDDLYARPQSEAAACKVRL